MDGLRIPAAASWTKTLTRGKNRIPKNSHSYSRYAERVPSRKEKGRRGEKERKTEGEREREKMACTCEEKNKTMTPGLRVVFFARARWIEKRKNREQLLFSTVHVFFCLFFLAGSKQAMKGNSGKILPSFSRCNVVFVASRWLPSIKTRRVLLKGNPTPCMAIYIVVDGRICQWEIEIFRVEVAPLHFASLSFNYDTG